MTPGKPTVGILPVTVRSPLRPPFPPCGVRRLSNNEERKDKSAAAYADAAGDTPRGSRTEAVEGGHFQPAPSRDRRCRDTCVNVPLREGSRSNVGKRREARCSCDCCNERDATVRVDAGCVLAGAVLRCAVHLVAPTVPASWLAPLRRNCPSLWHDPPKSKR